MLDDASCGIVERSPFVLIGTDGADGGLDVSPRGGPPGFVRVLDQRHLAIPDLNGNNLIDSLRAVVATGRVCLLLLVPGKDETLRINGAAWLTTDDRVLDLLRRRPARRLNLAQRHQGGDHRRGHHTRQRLQLRARGRHLHERRNQRDALCSRGRRRRRRTR
mgnify:CR=1 FL=1